MNTTEEVIRKKVNDIFGDIAYDIHQNTNIDPWSVTFTEIRSRVGRDASVVVKEQITESIKNEFN